MCYSFKRIGIYIRKNILVYLLIIAQLTAGLGLFIGSLNILSSAKQNLQKEKQQLLDTVIQINIPHSSYVKSDEQAMAMPYEQYLVTKALYKNELEIGYAVYKSINIVDIADEIWIDGTCYFMNEQLFEMLFNEKMNENAIYVGADHQQAIQDFIQNKRKSVVSLEKYPHTNIVDILSINDGEISLMTGERLNPLSMPATGESTLPINLLESYYPMNKDDCFIISMKYYPEYQKRYFEMREKFLNNENEQIRLPDLLCHLRAKIKNPDFDINLVSDFLIHLNGTNNYNFLFTAQDGVTDKLIDIQQLKSELYGYQIQSAALLAIALLGNMGVMMLFLQSRKKSLAIAKAYGASNLRLTLEIFAELAIVNLTGAGLSLFAIKYVMPIVASSMNVNAVTQPQNILYAAAFAIVCSIPPTIYALFNISKIQPIEKLKAI